MDAILDYDEISKIIERFQKLDPYHAYYLKDETQYERTGCLAPDTRDSLARGFTESESVLDVGCGDGRTLLDCADLFSYGTGIDESSDHMIAAAIRERDERGIHNVRFCPAKAVSLPFSDGSFDMVFTERGPLGHNDETLLEALRVLQPEGLIFVETPGTFKHLVIEERRFRLRFPFLKSINIL